jgi:predicted nucleotidyltransferase
MAVTYGPVPVLTELLAPLDGIDEAFIYGSWAARYHEHPGQVPNDLDVLVAGTPDPDDLFDAAETATRRLGRQVDVHGVDPTAWSNPESVDPFIRSVRERPRGAPVERRRPLTWACLVEVTGHQHRQRGV